MSMQSAQVHELRIAGFMASPNGYIDFDRWFPSTAGFISARTVPAHIRPLAGWRDHQVWGSYVPIVCPVCGSPNLEAHQVRIH